jgi:hypothetical protein
MPRGVYKRNASTNRSTCHIKDLTGRTFGRLIVLKADGLYVSSGQAKVMWWWCRCKCGSKVSVRGTRLTQGLTKSCGCLQKERREIGLAVGRKRHIPIIGQRFGRLLVVSRSSKPTKSNGIYYNCICKCGTKTVVASTNLRKGHVRSCGCSRNRAGKGAGEQHGYSKTPTYKSWNAMKSRCTNPKAARSDDYIGRGVRICTRWLNSFSAFLQDLGPRPTLRHRKGWLIYTLDRINVNGHYTPDNVRWATKQQQQHNLRKRGSHEPVIRFVDVK